jgi:hypothetical protein
VGCDGAMTLRHGAERRPHFAHRPGVECIARESALHVMGIRAIADGLLRQAARHEPYLMAIVCDFCSAGRMADLAKDQGLTVDENRALGADARPDILVRSSTGDPSFVVEVVVTHEPEMGALDAFRAQGLPVIVVKPTWEAIEGLREGFDALVPHDGLGPEGTVGLLSPCRLPRHLVENDEQLRACSQCGADARVLTLEVSTTSCYRCLSHARVLDVYVRRYGVREMITASASELTGVATIARTMGVRIDHRYSKTAGSGYWMNACACGAPLGDNFVYEGFSSREEYEPDLATPVRHYELCRSGHWTLLAERTWMLPATAGRRFGARGVCGDSAGVFERDEQLVQIHSFESSDDLARELSQFMSQRHR